MPLAGSPLDEADVRRMVRLLGQVIATPGGISEKRRVLMNGLCEIVCAPTWVWRQSNLHNKSTAEIENGVWSEKNAARPRESGNSRERVVPEIVSCPEVQESHRSIELSPTFAEGQLDGSKGGPKLTSVQFTSDHAASTIEICRNFGQPAFTEGETRIARLILDGVPWLHLQMLPHSQTFPQLSPRQREVLELLCDGWSRKQIAGHLDLSINTVYGYTKAIFQRFKIHSQAELIARFTQAAGGSPIPGTND